MMADRLLVYSVAPPNCHVSGLKVVSQFEKVILQVFPQTLHVPSWRVKSAVVPSALVACCAC
jgi:hypothetical protein